MFIPLVIRGVTVGISGNTGKQRGNKIVFPKPLESIV